MKRSGPLSLILMGSLVLGGCGSENADQSMYTFTTVNECLTSGMFSEAECQDLSKSALAEAPRFSSLEECEKQFGKDACRNASAQMGQQQGVAANGTSVQRHSGSYWMPMMMGFMAGRFMSGGSMMQGSQGLYRDPASPQTSSMYRTAAGDSVRADATGRVSNPSARLTQSMSHNARPAMSRSGGSGSRGGFFGGSGRTGGGS